MVVLVLVLDEDEEVEVEVDVEVDATAGPYLVPSPYLKVLYLAISLSYIPIRTQIILHNKIDQQDPYHQKW